MKGITWTQVAQYFVLIIAGYFGIDPPGCVAQVVAFAFGLAAAGGDH
ncbi:MAG TPA: hypothetical protein VKA86_16125 [Candidatus Krumholzibacteria bacterium]|nr:hypothetical protein [Candidatus Krumholzibacteria bacterium]